MKNLIFVITLITYSINSFAQIPGITITPNSHSLNDNWSLGWRFQANTNGVITSLGVYDENGDGLNTAKPVGIYTDAGVLIASTIVPAGIAATLIGNFRYQAIAPITLTAGSIYRVAALHLLASGDRYASCQPICAYTNSPEVTYIDDRFTQTNVLAFPANNNNISRIAFFGANFLAGQSVVPTLGQWGLIILGLLIIATSTVYYRIRKRSVSTVYA